MIDSTWVRVYNNKQFYSSNYIESGSSVRAPIFYDSNDTTYYTDPNSKSELKSLDLGYTSGQVYDTATQGVLFFNSHNESDIQAYSIGTILENFGGNYTKLTLDWHTGIRIGAYYGYGGIRFYNNSVKHYGGTEIFSVAKGDNNVRVEYILYVGTDVRAPIYYDSNNTGYYVDPASTSRMNTINADVLYSYGNVTAYSDERLKTDWEVLPSDFVEKLAKVKSGTYTRIDSGERQVGVGAQSLQVILKEAVSEDQEYLGVNYGNAALASAVELAKYVTALEQRISQLEARL